MADEAYQLTKTCRYASWASREIICNADYMEASKDGLSEVMGHSVG